MNQLKEAETKATALVRTARETRGIRMKEAKTDAETQIASYRKEKEQAYQGKANKNNGGNSSSTSALDAETSNDIAKFSRDFHAKKGSVEQMLVDMVTKVEVKAPAAR